MNIDNISHSDSFCIYQSVQFFLDWADDNCPEFLVEINGGGVLIKCVKYGTTLFHCDNIESAKVVLRAFMYGRNLKGGDVKSEQSDKAE